MKHILIFLSFTLFPCFVFAQKTEKATVRGNIVDKETTQPAGFATIQIRGADKGAIADVNGFFSIGNLDPGTYTVVVSLTGYEDFAQEVVLEKGEIEFMNIFINESGNKLEEVTISGKKEQARADVQVSKLTVTPKQIRSLPSAGGQSDIAQYLTVLPGVIFTGDQGGQLYIRGGSPVQNRILLDGMTIYNPFHSIGFFSVFETELIRNVDVLTGGFNADYGGRISAVVDVNTREGNRKRISGLVSASPFQAKAMIEGPIIPLKEDGGSSVSFVLTAKKALIDQTDEIVYDYVNDGAGIPFNYQDFYGKISLLAGNGSKVNLFGFSYDDGVNFDIADFSWKSSGGGMDFTLVPSNSNTIVNGVFTFSGYDSKIQDAEDKPRESGISGYFGGLNFTNFGRNSELKYGLELTGFRTDFQFVNFNDVTLEQFEYTTEIAVFLRWKYKFGNLVIEPGYRLQYYQSLPQAWHEPRLGLKYNISNRLRFKAAGGLYSQNLISTTNERDVVNLFVGFLSAPDERPLDPSTGERSDLRIQTAWHAVGGFEYDLLPNLDVNIESYYKGFTNLLALNRFKEETQDPNFIVETGDAYGLDISMKYEAKRMYVWFAYSLGYVNRNDGFQEYPPVFDRRHNLNVVTTYLLGKNRNWELGARWNFGSGFPFTQTQGFFTSYTFDEGIGTDFYSGNGDLGLIYSDTRNGGRLPYYHRLDISLKREFKLSKHQKLEVVASCTNVYDRENIFFFDRVNYERVNQLPIMPSLSATYQF
ncbi:MAG: TonB-dependent receptor [Saprospiraceae bacterium]|nr:TonB-dependent receptor [Saprospiraceae bacterium]